MLTNTLRVLVNELKKNFMRKEKKNFNILIIFLIPYKSSVKTFLK